MLKFSQLSILLFMVPLVVLISACNNGWGIKGEGPLVTEERALPEFHSVQSSVSAELILSRGKQKEVVIEAQQNILDHLKTQVRDGRLEIKFDENVGSHDGIKIHITSPNFREVALSGSGSARSENELKGDELLVSITGSGSMDLQARYERVSGNISGSGDMRLAGKGQYLDLRITGSGDIHALDFEAEQAKVNVTGSGDVEVDVEEQLEVSISGSGDLRYKGRPALKSSTNGSGRVSSI